MGVERGGGRGAGEGERAGVDDRDRSPVSLRATTSHTLETGSPFR